MKRFIFIALFLVFIKIRLSTSFDLNTNKFGEIIFAHVFFRHGDRMPIVLYPTDPNKETDFPFGLTQLTDIGKRQEFELGQWLRRRYDHLLSTDYKTEEIYVESSDFDRTLMSAQCNLAGLYQPVGEQKWNPDIHWQPIPVHTVPLTEDLLLVGAGINVLCPLYDLELARVENSLELKEINKNFKNIYDYASEHSGMDVHDFRYALKLYDTLAIEERYNLTIPLWARKIYPNALSEPGFLTFKLATWTRLMQRLKVGPLLGDVVKHFEQKRDGTLTPNRNVWMYSTHDLNIASILNTFESFDPQLPSYASSLLLELRLKNGEYFVTCFYRNDTEREPYLLSIMGCYTLCPLEQFISLLEPLIPSDFQQECNSVSTVALKMPSETILLVVAVSFSSVILLIILVSTCWMKRQPKNNWLDDIFPPGLPKEKCKEVIIGS